MACGTQSCRNRSEVCRGSRWSELWGAGARGVILLSHPPQTPLASPPHLEEAGLHRQPTERSSPWHGVSQRGSEGGSVRSPATGWCARVSHLMPTSLWSPVAKYCPQPDTEEGTEAQGP